MIEGDGVPGCRNIATGVRSPGPGPKPATDHLTCPLLIPQPPRASVCSCGKLTHDTCPSLHPPLHPPSSSILHPFILPSSLSLPLSSFLSPSSLHLPPSSLLSRLSLHPPSLFHSSFFHLSFLPPLPSVLSPPSLFPASSVCLPHPSVPPSPPRVM